MRIENIEVYGLESSVIKSGYPKNKKIREHIKNRKSELKFINEFLCNRDSFKNVQNSFPIKSINRCKKLGHSKSGAGHDCFLKGIIVKFDMTCTHDFLLQWMRYHFCDIESSESKMNSLHILDIRQHCDSEVDQIVIDNLKKWIEIFNNFERLNVNGIVKIGEEEYSKARIMNKMYKNCPLGFELSMGVVTNYLQEKNIYHQRKNHKLFEWSYYCKTIKNLPLFEDFCIK